MKLLCLSALVGLLLTACNVVRVQPGPNALQNGMEAAGNSGLVLASPGNYGDQALTNTQRSEGTIFVAADGVRLRTLHAHLDDAAFFNFDIDAGGAKTLALDLSGNRLGFVDGRVGNVVDEKGAIVSGRNITIDNTVFHDVTLADPSIHSEAIYAIAVQNFTVRNSTFSHIATFDIFFTYPTWWGYFPPATSNVTLEGNRFGKTHKFGGADHYYTVMAANTGQGPSFQCGEQVQGYIENWTVRNNVFELPTAYIRDCPARHRGPFVWQGNAGG